MNLFGMEGELKEVTERIAKHFKELEKVEPQFSDFIQNFSLSPSGKREKSKGRASLSLNPTNWKTYTRNRESGSTMTFPSIWRNIGH